MIGFNKPFFTGNETAYIKEAVLKEKISGNGYFTQKCHEFFREKYGFKKVLLTTSCTTALEMAAILINIKPGDEIIMPSFTFVSTANAFVLRGGKIVFADSKQDQPNIDEEQLEALITPLTKAIVVVHYAGVACNMDKICELAKKHNLFLIEDAAQAIDSYYNGKPLGSFGHLACFSFHETKNIISGEGGMLVINDQQFNTRAEIIWEKGTNRTAFFRGEVDKYGWIDIGSSFLPSDLIAAFLYAQLENLNFIQETRNKIWNSYFQYLQVSTINEHCKLPNIPAYASNNAHMFYLICKDAETRDALIIYLKDHGIQAIFHYLSLHSSAYFKDKHDQRQLPNSDKYTNCLLRLPFYNELSEKQIQYISKNIVDFYKI
ncbi:MAG: dTDP-4-amino-4,6-dideoxygalactose transaminase [Bacteroidota bacterium]|nr:dTDP-4-amino-4,6-dideoxygalactose transaminase [Bacteroidota bacterium]